jgi:UDP-N-acetylmuramoyl-L-alanyl-D-glutamate--2,6-diaminopimelate ligase
MMKTLEDLGSVLGAGAKVHGQADSITGITYDSRKVKSGVVFVAIPGAKFDGHDFVEKALAQGAAGIVLQADHAERFAHLDFPRLVVDDARATLGPLACFVYDYPTHHLNLVGVTGTNGKTTTTRMCEAIAKAAGEKTGTVGTLGTTIGNTFIEGDRTTPEASDLQAFFAQMRAQGVTSAAIEVASHALALGRIAGCAFDVTLFTNLTQDHLDYHKTMENYRDTKGMLFSDYAEVAKAAGKEMVAVVNLSDSYGEHYKNISKASRTLTYGIDNTKNADIVAENVQMAIAETRFVAKTPLGDVEVTLGFGGTFNVANALAAVGYGVARGFSPAVIAQGLATCEPVPGRFQPVRAGQSYGVLVDYAHTPDGLENVLNSARPLTQGRLIAVFGCGGDRDTTKRPKMGKIAGDLADIALVTSDNPRTEDPDKILADVLAGMSDVPAEVMQEVDRRKAIHRAVTMAGPNDTIVIAGKGHEDYQEIHGVKHHFSDVEVATQAITAAILEANTGVQNA